MMYGLYFHIPFCKRACSYCNFYFSTRTKDLSLVQNAMEQELELRKNYLPGKSIRTIYFGGGTPSLLDADSIEALLKKTYSLFDTTALEELTLEANPDDVSREKAANWKAMGINRISLGAQSLSEKDLKWMNRIHNSSQVLQAIRHLHEAGISNISADLIFNVPEQSPDDVEEHIRVLIGEGITHLSTYNLTLEEKTKLMHDANKGLYIEDEDNGAGIYKRIIDVLNEHGWISYEISNHAAQDAFKSRHNSSYWNQVPYLGIGPSAHSYNGQERSMNVASNARYIQSIQSGSPEVSTEQIGAEAAFNEWIMTRLRTLEGFLLDDMRLKLKENQFFSKNYQTVKRYIESGHITLFEDRIMLSTEGRLIADTIISDLMLV